MPISSQNRSAVLCIGEVLWDSLPSGLFLGGAPLNVAIHLHECGIPAMFASRVGMDELGSEIVRRVSSRGLETNLIQQDQELPTGFVGVMLDEKGSPTFEIRKPSAWDRLELLDELKAAAVTASAIVFGSLAQRCGESRQTIQSILDGSAVKICDINLRPPFVDRAIVEESLHAANVVKLNEDEMSLLAGWYGLEGALESAARNLADRFELETVCVTRGENGAAMLHGGRWFSAAGHAVRVVDAVGAGDAFLAGLIASFRSGDDPAACLQRANALGAYVATQGGATPRHDESAVRGLMARNEIMK